MRQVNPIKAFNDNYIWTLEHTEHNAIYVVDPGDAAPVLDYLTKHNKLLAGILVTHHHWDHTNGIKTLTEQFGGIPVYGPKNSPFDGITHPLSQGNELYLAQFDIRFTIIETPGHTLDHIAYANNDLIFCGDTLFSAGCGRLFEGTAEQLYTSLRLIAAQPDTCLVYCTHEYTRANLDFALSIEPTNQTLVDYHHQVSQHQNATVPSTIAKERGINPFLRCNELTVKEMVNQSTGQTLTDAVDIFTQLRKMKDTF